MTKYVLVDGTHGANRPDDFSSPTHDFAKALKAAGVEPAFTFHWSTDIDGLWGKDVQWWVGGYNLFVMAVPPLCPQCAIHPSNMLVIAFSHGAQVALNAFAMGLKGSLITVNPPVRSDMDAAIAQARPNIRRWVNLYGDWRDVWAVLGAIGDGHFGLRRQFAQADVNILVPGPHGDALRNPAHYPNWSNWIQEAMGA